MSPPRLSVALAAALGLLWAQAALAEPPAPTVHCGWFENPSPGNAWLTDRHGEWEVGLQGGRQADGEWPPEFPPSQWVRTNGHYGHGCACMRAITDPHTHKVIVILSTWAQPLQVCRDDPALTEPTRPAQ